MKEMRMEAQDLTTDAISSNSEESSEDISLPTPHSLKRKQPLVKFSNLEQLKTSTPNPKKLKSHDGNRKASSISGIEISEENSMSGDFVKFRLDVNRKLDEIYKQQLLSAEEIKLLRQRLAKAPVREEVANFKLPIDNKEEFDEVEEKLNEADMKNSFIQLLASFGGSNVQNVVHCMMNGVLNRHLAVQFSLRGKVKYQFSSTKVMECVIGE